MTTRRTILTLALVTAGICILPAPSAAQGVAEPDTVPGLAAWYRADTLQVGSGSPVETWPDASGNGHDLTSDNNGLPAVLEAVQVNQLPAVRVRKANSYSVAAPFDLGDHTLFLVLRADQTERALVRSEGNEFMGILLGNGGVTDELRYAAGQGAAYGTLPQAPPRGFGITVLGRQSDLMRGFRNGEEISTGAEHAAALRVGKFFDLAHSRYSRADGEGLRIAEMLIYNRFLSDGERGAVTSYLADKYAIEATAPEGEEFAPGGVLQYVAAGMAQLSTTSKINVNDVAVAVPWNRQDELDFPFDHDPEGQPTRLYCTQDETRVRLYASLPLTATVDGVHVRLLFRVNGALFLRGEGRSGVFGGEGGAGKGGVQAEVVATLNDGDYVEVVTLRAGEAGEVRVDPDTAVFIAEQK